MIKLVFLLLISNFSYAQQEAVEQQPVEQKTTEKQSVEQRQQQGLFFAQSENYKKALNSYYAKRYRESISLLDKEKDNKLISDSVHYLLGFNYYRLNDFTSAEAQFLEVTKNFNIKELSTAYYFLGMSQYNLRKYEEAMTSFELALDTSSDAKQDTKIESMIEKTVQMQNLEERNKQKFTMGLGAGYAYHTNVVAADPAGEDYSGHSLSYSGFLTYRAVSNLDSSFEPLIYYSDAATVNNKFKQNSTIISNDATQVFISAPYNLSTLKFNSSTSVNYSLLYLPTTEKRRDLSTTSYFVKQAFSSVSTESVTNEIHFLIGKDKSHLSYTDEADDQTAVKYEVAVSSLYKISSKESKFFNGEFGIIANNADGDNSKYHKYYLNMTYSTPSFASLYLDTKLSASNSDYYKSAANRNDFVSSLAFTFSKDLGEKVSSSFFTSVTNNASNIKSNRYTDFSAGLQVLWVDRF